jgi:thymidylate synthase ThyX
LDSVKPYVSNTDQNIYAIKNLPEEVAAVVFAKVSRSPKGFRESMAEVIADDLMGTEKARAFHEKWTLDYGHRSIAELAGAKIGVERVSRIATAELEQSNPYLSFIEYSQRYQQPQRGDWHNPFPMQDSDPDLTANKWYQLTDHEMFNYMMQTIYSSFERLVDGLVTYHVSQGKTKKEARPLAWEDARYVLPLATLANMAVVGNGRALRDGVVEMLSSRHAEVRQVATRIAEEAQAELPTLVKYVTPQPGRDLQRDLAEQMMASSRARADRPDFTASLQHVTHESSALIQVLSGLMAEHTDDGFESEVVAFTMSEEDKIARYQQLLDTIGDHETLPKALKRVHYSFLMNTSEVTYHQILRHRSATTYSSHPTHEHGYVVPPTVLAAGLKAEFDYAVETAKELWRELLRRGHTAEAEYAVCNACRRTFLYDTTLSGMLTLQRLRQFNPHAQWEIRAVVATMAEKIGEVNPNLLLKEPDNG